MYMDEISVTTAEKAKFNLEKLLHKVAKFVKSFTVKMEVIK